MAEAFWGAALGAFFTITGGWTLKTFAAWLADDPGRTTGQREGGGSQTRQVQVRGVTDRGKQQPPNAPAASTSSNADPKPPPKG